jgi:hypothetical protein
MTDASLYETDIYAWSEQQAAVLRGMAERNDLPNELDLANIAEEIESLGKSELHAAQSLLRLILSHALMAWADPDSDAARHWEAEAATWQIDLVGHLTPALSRNIDLNRVWKRALREADAKLSAFERESARAFLKHTGREAECPVPLEMLCAEDFEFGDLVARLAASLEAEGRSPS